MGLALGPTNNTINMGPSVRERCLSEDHKRLPGSEGDMSTCGMLHSIGSDLTHTWGRFETHQNGSIRSKQNGLRARDYGNTTTSRAEPVGKTNLGLKLLTDAMFVFEGIDEASLNGALDRAFSHIDKNQINRMMSHERLQKLIIAGIRQLENTLTCTTLSE
ncbi:hypothetical protein HYC85_004121 [Camellia sinensis]|uniref:Uncharacterized protein n=1 Tax=Camellia sinensis TaxID=4442 RepID=A0A7J7HXN0_CAMSI|nr:hypothetical protein HYC85_004121 [Camellia sinensis]